MISKINETFIIFDYLKHAQLLALVQIFKMLKYHSIDHQGSKSERLSYFNKRQPPPKTRGIGSETKYTNTTAKKTNI